MVLLHLLPLWSFRYFATTDGPSHLYNAWATKVLLTHTPHPVHQAFAINSGPVPNYLTQVLLVSALHLLPPWLAEKLVQTLYVVGLPLALRYVVRAWRPGAGFLALLAFPLVYSAVFQYGFYNFCLSVVLFLVVLGYWRRHFFARLPTLRHVVGLVSLLLVLYFAHPLPYLLAGFVVGLCVLEEAWRLPGPASRLTYLRTRLSILLIACLPSLLLMGWYLSQPTVEELVSVVSIGPGQLLHDWVMLEPLRFMGSAEGTYRKLLATLLFGMVGYVGWCHARGRALAPGGALALAAGLLVLAYVLLPDALLGGSILRPRLGLLSYLLLIGLLATVSYPRWLRQAVVGVVVVVAVLLLGFRYGKYRTLATGMDEYRTATSYLRPGASIASFSYGAISRMPNGKAYQSYIDVFPHATGYLGVERQLLNLENYEAHTGYFPVVWRPGQAVMTDRDEQPPRINWQTTPRTQWPDYVLLWGRNVQVVPTTNAQQLESHLAQHYHLVYRSPTKLLELYSEGPAG